MSSPDQLTPITVAYGDGIGPEIMKATLRVLDAAGAGLKYEVIEIGEKVYLSGNTAGIGADAWESLARTKVFLKAPITTPQGGGYKSLNVTARKTLGLFSNVRPCVAYAPFVHTRHPKMDVVIIRENEEDLYAGIEHRQTKQVYQTLKLITQPGSEKIIRYAFEYARTNGRKKVTVMVKDNIMKLTDGLFHDIFKLVAAEYPDIEHDSYIIDIGAARLADTPEWFDVIVTMNLYGDIISDIAAQVSGSVGFGPSANIGDKAAMFEAIHGSAPTIAGQDIANPSGLLLSAVMMLLHVGKNRVAERIHNAWLRTVEDGIATGDIYTEGQSKQRVGTQVFADAVIERLGKSPEKLECIIYPPREAVPMITPRLGSTATKTLVGCDIFLDWDGGPSGVDAINALTIPGLKLLAASNRGLKVWPGETAQEVFVDHWRFRYLAAEKGATVTHRQLLDQMGALVEAGYDLIKTENLCDFDGKAGYSLMQGQ
jgi:isocitrate dehydrogenase